eukprot:403369980
MVKTQAKAPVSAFIQRPLTRAIHKQHNNPDISRSSIDECYEPNLRNTSIQSAFVKSSASTRNKQKHNSDKKTLKVASSIASSVNQSILSSSAALNQGRQMTTRGQRGNTNNKHDKNKKAKAPQKSFEEVVQTLNECDQFKAKSMMSMVKIIEQHPHSFMFDFIDQDKELTLQDIKQIITLSASSIDDATQDANSKAKDDDESLALEHRVKDFEHLELLVMKLFDGMETTFSDLHEQILELVEADKKEFVCDGETIQTIFNGLQKISDSEKNQLLDTHSVFRFDNGTQLLDFIPEKADEVIDLTRKLETLMLKKQQGQQ